MYNIISEVGNSLKKKRDEIYQHLFVSFKKMYLFYGLFLTKVS
jgi:hypothetical protein